MSRRITFFRTVFLGVSGFLFASSLATAETYTAGGGSSASTGSQSATTSAATMPASTSPTQTSGSTSGGTTNSLEAEEAKQKQYLNQIVNEVINTNVAATVAAMNKASKGYKKTPSFGSAINNAFEIGKAMANTGGIPNMNPISKAGNGGYISVAPLSEPGTTPAGSSYSGSEEKQHGFIQTALSGTRSLTKTEKAAQKVLKNASVVGKLGMGKASGSTSESKNRYAVEHGITLEEASVKIDRPVGYAFKEELAKEPQKELSNPSRQPASSWNPSGEGAGHQQK